MPGNAETAVRQWLEDVVLGLNLCPFARKPYGAGKVRFVTSEAQTLEALLEALCQELEFMDSTPVSEVETSIIIIEKILGDFADYNDFLSAVDELIVQMDLEGVLQVASFHPDYCFADAKSNDQSNLTNRSPYPLLHILREDLLEEALDKFPDADRIPETNIKRMNNLSAAEIAKLFPYLVR